MTDLKNKVAVVTGASSGIGAAIVKVLLNSGMKVVGVARRIEKVEELGKNHKKTLFAVKADLTKKEDIRNAIAWTTANVGPIDAIINNAGVAKLGVIDEIKPDDIATTLDTNVLAVTLFTQEVVKSMKKNNINGTIINVCSVAGHYITTSFPGTSIYNASKFAVRAFTESIRAELAKTGSKIRITNLSPGMVESEMTNVHSGMLDSNPHLKSEDIGDAVKYVLMLPQNVNIAEMIIRPTGESLF